MAKKRSKKRSGTVTPILVVGGLVLVLVVLWLASRSSSPDAARQAEIAEAAGPYPQVERVSLAEAKAGFDDNSVLIVDVRSETEYLAGHIPGAVLMPSSEMSSRHQELPQDKLLYLYCT